MATRTQNPGYTATVLSTVRPPRAIPRARTKWLWPGYLPPGALGLIDGDPDNGKSLVTLDFAARVTKGLAWPDGTPGDTPANVLLICSEDTKEELVERLNAAGADLSKIILLEEVAGIGPSIPRDIHIIEQIIKDRKAKLVIIDPIMAYLGVDAYRDQAVRKAVSPLAKIAQTTGCTIIMVRHLNKSAGRNAKTGGGGSMGLIGQCRFGYLIAPDPDHPLRRVMASVKMNIGTPPPSRGYRMESHMKSVHVVWEEHAEEKLDANDLMMARRVDTAERNERQEAVDFLKAYLTDHGGIAHPTAILKDGREAGFTQSQLRTAKKKLQLKSRRWGEHWLWCHPDHDPKHAWLSVVAE